MYRHPRSPSPGNYRSRPYSPSRSFEDDRDRYRRRSRSPVQREPYYERRSPPPPRNEPRYHDYQQYPQQYAQQYPPQRADDYRHEEYGYDRRPEPYREPHYQPPVRDDDRWSHHRHLPARDDTAAYDDVYMNPSHAPPQAEFERRDQHDSRDRVVHREQPVYGERNPPSEQAPPPRSYSESKPRGRAPSEQSKDVILLGLDPELTETELGKFLQIEHKAALSSVKIVRDRGGQSKGFAFASFQDLEGSKAFINDNYPTIQMPALHAHSEPRNVKIDFSAPPPGGHYQRPAHDGTRDIGVAGGGKRVLLVRGLTSSTTSSDVIYAVSKEIARMMGRQGQESKAESTIVRTVMIVEKGLRSSWGFTFVELASSELAAALLPFLISPQHQPSGFVINGVPVAASFADPAAFAPMPAGPLGGEHLIRASRHGGIGYETIDKPDGTWVAYRLERAGPSEIVPRGAPSIKEDGTVELTPEHRSFLGSLAGAPPQALAAASVDAAKAIQQAGIKSVNLSGSMAPIRLGGMGKSKRKEEPAIVTIQQKRAKVDLEGDEEEDTVGADSKLLSRTKGAKIIPPTSNSSKILKNISKWNTKQSELAAPDSILETGRPKGVSEANATLGTRRQSSSNKSAPPVTTSAGITSASATAPAPEPAASTPDNFDYTDISSLASTGKVACLLCQRQFKAEDILRKHVAHSDLHKTNLRDPTVCQAGQRRKAASTPSSSSTPEPASTQYRDRAAERRETYHQPAKPTRADLNALTSSTAAYQGIRTFPSKPSKDRAAPPPPPPQEEVKKEEPNVGNKLLSKMGWQSGEGLGANGEGRAEPIKVQQFEARAGLGASKGVEAGRWSGPGGWQQRGKDVVSTPSNPRCSSLVAKFWAHLNASCKTRDRFNSEPKQQ
ncbi:hypothetical protein L202_02970 [Cryptococcus amylolentus CBS 6039]|uniref:G-patch domain-containing protein n=1 Tax=Cryptococcus amylolentus CBS 6039 TaxID=1295533 RepID=A0A1E3HZ19_9TREE|nr:hypothetical protein L202_02970 [Cryptococcus amylolentus CBS 6039]ODN80821.1 hypothetical protein L202_02970 [Cryptococcus amylolentus CBS 6039]